MCFKEGDLGQGFDGFPSPHHTRGNSAAVNDFTLPLQTLFFPETMKTEEKCCHKFQTVEKHDLFYYLYKLFCALVIKIDSLYCHL